MEKTESLPARPNLGLNSNDLASRMRRRETIQRPIVRAPRYMTEVRERSMAVMPQASKPSNPIQHAPQNTYQPPTPQSQPNHIQVNEPIQVKAPAETAVEDPVIQNQFTEEVVASVSQPVQMVSAVAASSVPGGPIMNTGLQLTTNNNNDGGQKFSIPRFNALKFRKYMIEAVVVGILAFLAFGTYSIVTHKPGEAKSVQATVETKIAYDVFIPGGGKFSANPETLDYNTRTEIYSYMATRKDGVRIYVNEAPDTQQNKNQFIPFIAKDAKKVVTQFGTLDIAQPDQLKGGQAALGSIDGTLIFIRTEKPMLEADWQHLLNNLKKQVD